MGSRLHKGAIKNPWVSLAKSPSYILKQDKQLIRTFNDKLLRKKSWHRSLVYSSLLPEPFIGNPHTASVVLLAQNPGVDCGIGSCDVIWHQKPSFKRAVQANLRHRTTHYPFYPLDPRFKKSGVGQWWRKYLKGVLAEIQDDKLVARKLCVIEWFPYHSMKSKMLIKFFRKQPLFSQNYSFTLVRKALRDKRKVVVVMRNLKVWSNSIGPLKRVFELKNQQSCYLSRNNVVGPKSFQKLLRAIKG